MTFRKLFAAFEAAEATHGRPTVILAKTKKGFGMGGAGELRMTAHQTKKLDIEALRAFRDRFALPLSDEQVAISISTVRPTTARNSSICASRRQALGGYLPARRRSAPAVAVPPLATYADFALHADGKTMSTTMAAVRLFSNLLKDETLGPRIVPIVADEARTFGMANLFRQVGIYSPFGQLYEPEDSGSMLYYRETKDGQLLEEGITEAGAISSWIAAATSYSVHGLGDASVLHLLLDVRLPARRRPDLGRRRPAGARLPDRGHRRAHDARRRGPAASGRLQPSDRRDHSELPRLRPRLRLRNGGNPRSRRPLDDGGRQGRVLLRHRDERELRAAVDAPDAEAGIVRGLYRFASHAAENSLGFVRLLGSGAILPEVIEAARMLEADWDVSSEVWSATSYAELARDAREAERHNRLNPLDEPVVSHLAACLPGGAPIIAASDYVRAYPQLIAAYVEARFVALGTDGFGRSDTRQALRAFFEVDRRSIVIAALSSLASERLVAPEVVADAIERYGVNPSAPPPWTI